MSIAEAIILSIVEGFSEFLPISSTAHLIITSNLLNLPQSEFVSFYEVFIQAGAILAVIVLLWRLVISHTHYFKLIAVSFVPTALIGFVMRDTIKNVFFHSNSLIGWSLVGVALIFILVEWLVAQKHLKLSKDINKMTYKEAFLIGVIQAAAIVPGVSRAGAVIVGMMFMKYKRSEAAIYSFLLAVPTILGAAGLDLLKTSPEVFTPYNLTLVTIGFVVAFLSALVFIKWLISYLQKNTLNGFAVYRIAVGLSLLLFL